MRRRELAFQSHIIDSYKYAGGTAKKWVDSHAKGRADLVCALPGYGIHLLEVKHRPEFGPDVGAIKNQLEPLQKHTAEEYIKAGGQVMAAVVGCSDDALKSRLAFFDPTADVWYSNTAFWVPYIAKDKYDVQKLAEVYYDT